MKNEQLYHKTVDILVQAYFNDTLQCLNSCACAIGNLVAYNMNYRIIKDEWGNVNWENQLNPCWDGWITVHTFLSLNMENYIGVAKEQIDSTGYTPFETQKIEQAFELAYEGDDPMFNALCSVIDELDNIHENVDPVITITSKQKFVKI